MNKEEIYEASLKMLALSGQGVPTELLKPHLDWSLVEELIDEGKLSIEHSSTGFEHLIINDDKYQRKAPYLEAFIASLLRSATIKQLEKVFNVAKKA